MMKTITVKRGDDVREYGVNNSGYGLFVRRSDGTFVQKMGTCDFYAGNAKSLRRKIQPVFLAIWDEEICAEISTGWRMIDKFGWN